ncbi:MAG: hypothetical protein A3J38_02850 [Gammaproteobacteria bacterium RIFCSPHIGHO2_12_FULL_45_9]|nr:MAG: hypothetical protein A3J38_02850 [Gammaproteobacteria bacterium RIFCSPHIGHO2_12_FULL_45_9]
MNNAPSIIVPPVSIQFADGPHTPSASYWAQNTVQLVGRSTQQAMREGYKTAQTAAAVGACVGDVIGGTIPTCVAYIPLVGLPFFFTGCYSFCCGNSGSATRLEQSAVQTAEVIVPLVAAPTAAAGAMVCGSAGALCGCTIGCLNGCYDGCTSEDSTGREMCTIPSPFYLTEASQVCHQAINWVTGFFHPTTHAAAEVNPNPPLIVEGPAPLPQDMQATLPHLMGQ